MKRLFFLKALAASLFAPSVMEAIFDELPRRPGEMRGPALAREDYRFMQDSGPLTGHCAKGRVSNARGVVTAINRTEGTISIDWSSISTVAYWHYSVLI